jgi:hypothetical protein
MVIFPPPKRTDVTWKVNRKSPYTMGKLGLEDINLKDLAIYSRKIISFHNLAAEGPFFSVTFSVQALFR